MIVDVIVFNRNLKISLSVVLSHTSNGDIYVKCHGAPLPLDVKGPSDTITYNNLLNKMYNNIT